VQFLGRDDELLTACEEEDMHAQRMIELIWLAGGIHAAIVLANIPLLGRLRVRENLVNVPNFLRQIVYVHWFYIVLIVGLFSALCFGFAPELAGGSGLGRFLSLFLAGFWLLRIGLQWFYYDPDIRRQNRGLDALYNVALVALVAVFVMAGLHPGK
jgi:hypothetical protein